MTLTGTKLRLLPLLVAVSVVGTGCGSVSKLVGGKKRRAAAGQSSARTSQLVASFTVTADPRTGEFTITPAGEAGVQQQATPYNRSSDLNLSGRASYNASTMTLSGDVTLSSTSPTTFHNVKVIVTSISASDVGVKNPTGITDLTGANKPYWSFGDLPGNGSVTRNWQFTVPSGVSFSFALALYADVWSAPPGDGGAILGLWFLPGSPAKGWAVGQNGKILYTSDGGLNWTAQTSNVSVDLRDVYFVNSERGWAVGANCTILATTNGGKTWRRQETEFTDFQLNAVAFVDINIGYVVGANGLVLVTYNGGASWDGSFQAGGDELYDVEAIGGRTWIAGNAATILFSDNYGQSWVPQPLATDQLPFPQIGLNAILCVDFVDSNRGWIGGTSGLLFSTTDGGQTWVRRYLTSDGGYRPNITDIKFASATHGWVTVMDRGIGTVIRTQDGGNTWLEVLLPTIANLHVITATDARKVWVGGDGGILLLTQNGDNSSGGTWFPFLEGSAAAMNEVDLPSRNVGYAVGNQGAFLRTQDGGKTWQQVPGAPFTHLYGVHFIDEVTGWIVGANGAVFKTIDGGDSWEQQFPPTSRTLLSIYMLDENRGWIVGQSGTILYTSNGGMDWQVRTPSVGPIGATLHKVKFLPDGSRGFIVGSSGTVLMTLDGTTWEPGYAGTTEPLNDIAVEPGGNVWIVGNSSVIRKLSSGSFSWSEQSSPLGGRPTFRGVEFIDAHRGFIVGSGGALLRTVDGGETWTAVESGTIRELRAIDFFDEDFGAAVGQGGIIKTFR